jgi:putative ABC transport system permease protein
LSILGDLLRLALGALRANKVRGTLTTLGVVIGVTTVVVISAIINGLNTSFADQIEGIGSNLLYVQKYPWTQGENWWTWRNRRDIGWTEYRAIRDGSRIVEAVAPTLSRGVRVTHEDKWLDGVNVTGTTEDYRQVMAPDPAQGRFLTQSDVHYRRAHCVVGAKIADELFTDENPIGQRLKVDGLPYRVIGVLPQQGEILGFDRDSQIYIPIGAYLRHFGGGQSMDIIARVKAPEQLSAARDELTGILRRARHLAPTETEDFALNEQSALTELYQGATGALYTTATVIASIALVVGGIGIMNIMLVAVTERVREIGIRKAVGARRAHILGQFLLEAILVSGVGGVIGVGIGYGAALLLSQVPFLEPRLTLSGVGVGLGFSLFVGVLFGVYPAARAAALDPVTALGEGGA